ncbi:MAG: hypothetical protein K9K64_08630 [Desulfohalobiaceae bacterium]|nr:hypothetical protein [Desulfohalobiaceae bacterium]
MRMFVLDELDPAWMESLRSKLEQTGRQGAIKDIYWFEVPKEILTPTQQEHLQSCGPYVLSLETGKTCLKLELLVRARNTLRCTCTGSLTREQRIYALDQLEGILAEING